MTSEAIAGVILAGGLARRMGGGDKPMRQIAGRTILTRVIDVMTPQCDGLVLNANGDAGRFARFGLPVVADSVEGFAGPLAGVLSGLDWVAAHHPRIAWVVSIPADCPILPKDLVARLQSARQSESAQLAVARSGDQIHPVVGVWPVALREELRHALIVEELRRIDRWTARYPIATVDWPLEPVDPFFNANTPDDLAEAERLVAQHGL